MEHAADILRDQVSSQRCLLGGQLAIFEDGDLVVDVAAGTQGPVNPMSVGTLHNTWCGTKGIFHVATLHALWERNLAESPIQDLVSRAVRDRLPRAIAGLSASELISHKIGLPDPHVMEVMHIAPSQRLELVLGRIGTSPRSSVAGTYVPSKLLEVVLSSVTSRSAAEYVDEWCARHIPYSNEIRFDIARDALPTAGEQIGPYVLDHYEEPVYSYHDRVPQVACDDRLAAGGYASMRGLASFYAALAGTGNLDPGFVDWLWTREPINVWDVGLGDHISFVSGFQTTLPGFRVGGPMLGLPGLTGASYGVALRDRRRAAAFMVNMFFQSVDDIDFFRARMIRAICNFHRA